MRYFSDINDYYEYYLSSHKALWEILKYDPETIFVSPAGSLVIHSYINEHSDHDFAAFGFNKNNRLLLSPDKAKKRTIDVFYYNVNDKINSLQNLSSDPMQYPFNMYHWFLVDIFSNHPLYLNQIGSVFHDNRYLFLFKSGLTNSIDYVQNIHNLIEDPDGIWSTDPVWRKDFLNYKFSTKFAKMNIYILKMINYIIRNNEIQIQQDRGDYSTIDSYKKQFDFELNNYLKSNHNIDNIKIDQINTLQNLLNDIRN